MGGLLLQLRMEITYVTKKGIKTNFSSDEMSTKAALELAEDLEKTGRVKHLTLLDEHDASWTLKQLRKFLEEVKTEPYHITVYFDGGFDRETRKAGLGCVIYYEQNEKSYRIRRNASVEGLVSNNEAEYAALHLGLTELEFLEVHHLPVSFIGDSKVVVNQLNDEWPVYESELSSWLDRIENKIEKLGITPSYEVVSRKMNREADHLATQALAGIEITSHLEQ